MILWPDGESWIGEDEHDKDEGEHGVEDGAR